MLNRSIFFLLVTITPIFGTTKKEYSPYDCELCSAKGIQKKEFSFDPLTEEEKLAISQFIYDLSTKSIQELLELKTNIENKLTQFRKIYPLLVVNFILSDAILYEKVRSLSQDEKKWVPFTLILTLAIQKAKDEGKMEQYLSEFADLVNLDKELIRSYIDKGKYKELVKYLFQL